VVATESEIRLYTTCPHSKDVEASLYAERLAEVARWGDEAGCHGIPIYTDNGIADPWLVAQLVIQSTGNLRPLIAVQPLYIHPYAAAKMVATLAYLHGRPVDLNMVAGGFRDDLLSLGDATEHDARYDRRVEHPAPGRSPRDAEQTAEGVVRELRAYLRQTLPLYILPSRWLVLPALPKNRNGKTDRLRLRELFRERCNKSAPNAAYGVEAL
jgi:hypothetical protein